MGGYWRARYISRLSFDAYFLQDLNLVCFGQFGYVSELQYSVGFFYQLRSFLAVGVLLKRQLHIESQPNRP